MTGQQLERTARGSACISPGTDGRAGHLATLVTWLTDRGMS